MVCEVLYDVNAIGKIRLAATPGVYFRGGDEAEMEDSTHPKCFIEAPRCYSDYMSCKAQEKHLQHLPKVSRFC